jgi:hypothetical protein
LGVAVVAPVRVASYENPERAVAPPATNHPDLSLYCIIIYPLLPRHVGSLDQGIIGRPIIDQHTVDCLPVRGSSPAIHSL